MRAAAGAAGADADGFLAQRERDVGVGGGAMQMRADIQMRIYGAGDLHNARAGIQFRSRALADLLDLACQSLRLSVATDSDVDGVAQSFFQTIDFLLRFRPQINSRSRGLRNRINGGSALEDADVVSGLLLAGARDLGLVEASNDFGQRHQWIGLAEIAPGVPAFAAQSDFEAAAAEGVIDDGLRAGAVHYQRGSDIGAKGRSGKDMSHAAQVAFAFFA